MQIYSSINRINDLLDDILTLNKIDQGKISLHTTEIDIIDFCNRLIIEIKKQIKSERVINLIFDPNLSIINTDKLALQLIFKNLIENAIKYSPDESPIIFEVSQSEQKIIFKVKDEGIGIDPQLGDRLFESFKRGQNVGNIPGTGLGLSIVKQLVDFLSGYITVDSELNQGTMFTVSFHKNKVYKKNIMNEYITI